MSQPWEARFWAKVDKQGPDGCWVWTANKGFGYGRFWLNGQNLTAHRLIYEHLVGPVPSGLQLDHLCRNRACCNPSHLEVVTPQVNQQRGTSPASMNAQKTHCIHGHEFTPENTVVKTLHQGTPGRTGRSCRLCRRAWDADRRARRRLSRLEQPTGVQP